MRILYRTYLKRTRGSEKNSDYDFFFHWQLNPFNYNFRKGVQENLLKFLILLKKIFFCEEFL